MNATLAPALRAAAFFIGILVIGILVTGFLGGPLFAAGAQETAQKDPWPDLAKDIFTGRSLADGSGVLAIDMPGRAEDAAIVPLTVRSTLPPGDPRRVSAFTVVIDENPAPVAATFTIGSSSLLSSISTRVRVNSYTNVHAVAELSDGRLYVVSTYVKASGGCSAPASKNADKTDIGQMRFRQFTSSTEAATGPMREAQVMIRHPNNSGLQMDQVTRLYVPAFFLTSLKVWQGEDLLLAVEGSISIAEDPNFRFTYLPNGATTFRVEAIDTKDHVFKGSWPIAIAGAGNLESSK